MQLKLSMDAHKDSSQGAVGACCSGLHFLLISFHTSKAQLAHGHINIYKLALTSSLLSACLAGLLKEATHRAANRRQPTCFSSAGPNFTNRRTNSGTRGSPVCPIFQFPSVSNLFYR